MTRQRSRGRHQEGCPNRVNTVGEEHPASREGYCVDGSRFDAESIASHQQCLGLIILCWGGACSAFWDG